MKSAWIIAGAVAATVTLSTVGYLAYFDHKRRSDPEFRKKLKLERRKAAKKRAQEDASKEESKRALLDAAFKLARQESIPTDPNAVEKYFMSSLQRGEELLAVLLKSPESHNDLIEAAACFYKAIKVFPNPMELLQLLQKQAPESLMTLIFAMLADEATQDREVYFESLKKKHPTLKLKTIQDPVNADELNSGKQGLKLARTCVIADQPFEEGQVILYEDPVITCPRPDLNSNGHFCCDYCLKMLNQDSIDPDSMISCTHCGDMTLYCSTNCRAHAQKQFHATLCPNNPQNKAAKVLVEYCSQTGLVYPLMVARFVAKMVWKQGLVALKQQQQRSSAKSETPQIQEEWMHLEYLGFTPAVIDEALEKECQLVREALAYASPGAIEFLTIERYAAIKGSFMVNTFAHSDKSVNLPALSANEKPRSANPKSNIYGVSMHFVGAHFRQPGNLSAANVRVEFEYLTKTGLTPKIKMIALRNIEEGEELTVVYENNQEAETVQEINCDTTVGK